MQSEGGAEDDEDEHEEHDRNEDDREGLDPTGRAWVAVLVCLAAVTHQYGLSIQSVSVKSQRLVCC